MKAQLVFSRFPPFQIASEQARKQASKREEHHRDKVTSGKNNTLADLGMLKQI